MAESGQQPTVDATLVNDIFEMLMEMDIRKIDIRLQRQYFDRPAQLTTTGSQSVSVVRLRKFMSLLQKTVQNHSNAQNAADEPESLVPTAATGHTHGEQPGGVYRLDIADARLCTVTVTVRRDTKAKCEAVCDFGLVYIKRGNLQPGGRRASRLAPLLPRRRRRRRRLLMNSARRRRRRRASHLAPLLPRRRRRQRRRASRPPPYPTAPPVTESRRRRRRASRLAPHLPRRRRRASRLPSFRAGGGAGGGSS